MDAPLVTGVCGPSVKLLSNVTPIRLPTTCIFHYKFIMTGVTRADGSEQKLSCKYRFDGNNVERQARVRDAFNTFFCVYETEFFDQPRNCISCDCVDTIYTAKKLNINDDLHFFHLSSEHLVGAETLEAFSSIDMKISEATPAVFDPSDLSFLNGSSKDDGLLRRFLETVLFQNALFNATDLTCFNSSKWVVNDHTQLGYKDEQFPTLREGKRTSFGADCRVRPMLGTDGSPQMSLTVDWDPCPSQCQLNLLTKAMFVCERDSPDKIVNYKRLNSQMKKLQVFTKHTGSKHYFEIDHMANKSANSEFVIFEDQKMTVSEYFKNRYNYHLRWPKLMFLVAERKRSKEGEKYPSFNYYPMEVCHVAVQEVRPSMVSPKQMKDVERLVNDVPALERLNRAQVLRNKIGLTNDNVFMQGMGVTVGDGMLEVTGRVLEPPRIGFANAISEVLSDGSWKPVPEAHFVHPARLEKWAVCAILNGDEHETERLGDEYSTLTMFLTKLVSRCRRFGMQVAEPYETFRSFNAMEAARPNKNDPNTRTTGQRMLKEILREVKDEGCNFVLFITSQAVDRVHESMKVQEREFEIVTQNVKLDTVLTLMQSGARFPDNAIRAREATSTMNSLVSKINIKCGGLNYKLILNGGAPVVTDRFLYIGIHTAKAKPGNDSPLLIGYSANWPEGISEFVGDVRLVTASLESDEVEAEVCSIIGRCYKKFCLTRQYDPNAIFVYRSSLPERRHNKAKEAAETYLEKITQPDQHLPLTYFIVDRHHNIRMARKEAKKWATVVEQNLLPGTIIDTEIIHPMKDEFFLNSHVGPVGTSCVPKYTLISCQEVWDYDLIESMTFALAYASQALYRPTSVPAPLFIAEKYVERGQKLFRVKEADMKNSRGEYVQNKATQHISYEGTVFEDVRINA